MAELKDETGNRYGRLTVLRKYRSEERIVIAAYSAVKDLPGKTPPVVTCGECRHWLTSYAAEYSSSGRCGLNGIARGKGFFCAEGER